MLITDVLISTSSFISTVHLYDLDCINVKAKALECTLVLSRYRKFYIVCRDCLYRDISHITI